MSCPHKLDPNDRRGCVICGPPPPTDAEKVLAERDAKIETLTKERDAARDNFLNARDERDAARSLLDRFRESHGNMALHDDSCDLCVEAERISLIS